MLLDTDKTGAARAINHLAVSGSHWHPSMASPLMKAIIAKDSLVALLLLTNGARPGVDFSAFIKAYHSNREPNSDSKRNREEFEVSNLAADHGNSKCCLRDSQQPLYKC